MGDVRGEPDYRAPGETGASLGAVRAPVGRRPAVGRDQPARTTARAHSTRTTRGWCNGRGPGERGAAIGPSLRSVEQAYLGTAEALAAALEAKDSYTAEHSRSIAENAEAVGRTLGLDAAELRTLRFGAAFHDIGKLAIPEAILNKPGRLTEEERARIERHTVIGEQILAPIEFLAAVRPLVRHGHERWDGAGYPDGLAGEEIPLGARIIFACDAYDAMTTDGPTARLSAWRGRRPRWPPTPAPSSTRRGRRAPRGTRRAEQAAA